MPQFLQRWINGIQAWVQNNPRKAALYGGITLSIILGFFLTAPVPHVELAGEPIFSTGPTWLTNSILTTIIVDIILLVLVIVATIRMNLIPSGLQNAFEAIIEYIYGLAESIAGKNVKRFFPISATLFFFVIFSNYSGLIPTAGSLGFCHPEAHGAATHGETAPAEGSEVPNEATPTPHSQRLDGQLAMSDGNLILLAPAAEADPNAEETATNGNGTCDKGEKLVPLFRAPSADLNVTLALSLVTMGLVQYFGFSNLGTGYLRKFWNPSGTGFMKGINIFVGGLELVSEVARVISFTFRLFGNIFAGEVVLATMAFLCAYLIPLPFYFLEVLVGAVQALVFMMLSLVFFSMAVVSHGEHHDEAHAEHH